jgi:hypothetical protein
MYVSYLPNPPGRIDPKRRIRLSGDIHRGQSRLGLLMTGPRLTTGLQGAEGLVRVLTQISALTCGTLMVPKNSSKPSGEMSGMPS